MNMPRQSTTFPRWLVLAIGVAAMMSGTGTMAGQHEAVPPEQVEKLEERAQEKNEAKKPDRESWTSGMSRQQEEGERKQQREVERAKTKAGEQAAVDPEALAEEPEDTEKIDETAAERAARQRAARQEKSTSTDSEPVSDETVEQIIEKRSGDAAKDDDEDDTDGPPDGS